MNLSTLKKLNPICEILGLIYLVNNYDSLKKEVTLKLDESGVNGQLFIKNNFKILDKYIKEFKKNMIIEEENELFSYEEDDFNLFLLIVAILINYDNNMEYLHSLTENEARNLILKVYYEMNEEDKIDYELDSLSDIFNYIEKQNISDKNKWKLFGMLNNSKNSIESIIKIIDNNRYAYEQAYNSVEDQLLKLMDKLEKYVTAGECEVINNLINNEGKYTMVPSLAFAVSVFEMENTVFAGVLIENIYKEQVKAIGNKAELILKLKALSDNSKLETIALLKKGPKYTLEIAESLNLTSATVSYHMSTLLEIGLVTVEKKQGKVYYHLNKVAIEKFIDDLNNTLL